jgi:hypothetical protein
MLQEESMILQNDLDALIVDSHDQRRRSNDILRATEELASEEDCWRRSHMGNQCPRCERARLHELVLIENEVMVHRCSLCGYTVVKAATR